MYRGKKKVPEKKFEEAIRKIREWIMDGTFEEEELLNEVDLANNLNMSRTPVREAMTYLYNAGLLTMLPGSGCIVSKMTKQDIEEILDLREALEPLAASSAIKRIPDSEINKHLDIWLSAKNKAENGIEIPAEIFSEWDSNLHGLLKDYCTNERLKNILSVLTIQTNLFVMRSWETKAFVIDTINQHLAILKSLKTRNCEDVNNSILFHIRSNKHYHLD